LCEARVGMNDISVMLSNYDLYVMSCKLCI
jgi:hypothetical protein